MNNSRHSFLQVLKWDFRLVLGLALVLVVVIATTFAQTAATPLIRFDFGGSALSDQAAGYVAVKGSLTTYPTTSGGITYGWSAGAADVAVFSSPAVADKVQRDSNGGNSPATFTIGGLNPGPYSLEFVVGSADNDVSSLIQIGSAMKVVSSATGTWKTISMATTTDDGTIDVQFAGANALTWVVNGLRVFSGTAADTTPSFALGVSPKSQTVTAGETASFSLGVTPLDGYAQGVGLSASGLVSGMSAEIAPASATNLPMSAVMRISTQSGIAPASYEIVVTANGDDAAKTKKTTVVTLTVQAATVADGQQPGGSTTGGAPVIVKTAEEMAADNRLIDEFAADQAARIPTDENISEIGAIDLGIGGIPTFQLPEPASPSEKFLQGFVASGIIAAVVDTAPHGERLAVKPEPWWRQIVLAIFRPTN